VRAKETSCGELHHFIPDARASALHHNHSPEDFGSITGGINLWWGEKHTGGMLNNLGYVIGLRNPKAGIGWRLDSAAASRWGLCLFSRVRRRQHHPRTGFAEPSCRAARIEPEDHQPDPDPRKTCSGTPSWFPAVWPIAPRHPSRSDSDAERPSGRYLTAGPMVRIRFPPRASQQRTVCSYRPRWGTLGQRRGIRPPSLSHQ
jgi:hypothetical protein